MERQSLLCPICGVSEAIHDTPIRCPRCGSPLFVERERRRELYDAALEEAKRSRDLGVWSFHRLLPTKYAGLSLGEGWTPLTRSPTSMRYASVELFFKNESLNPSSTFIDRGAAVALEHARELESEGVYVAGTGDIVVSMAMYARAYGMPLVAYVPSDVDAGHLMRALLSGARLVKVSSYSEAIDFALSIGRGRRVYRVVAATMPIGEGYRTISFEIYLQLRGLPDTVLVPVGDGVLAIALYRGFEELSEALGLDMPRIVAVRCSPDIDEGVKDKALAELMVERPLALQGALEAARKSGGTVVAVTSREALRASLELAKREGMFVDPVGVVGYAALLKLALQGYLDRGERVVVLLSGSPFKDPFLLFRIASMDRELERELVELEGLETLSLSETQLEILRIVAERGPINICGIYNHIRMLGRKLAMSTLYYHLKNLVRNGLVECVRGDKTVMYIATERALAALRKLYGSAEER